MSSHPTSQVAEQPLPKIESLPQNACHVCGSSGRNVYRELTDRIGDAGGTWNVSLCTNSNCKMYWLDPMPTEETIALAYTRYFTHEHRTENPVQSSKGNYSRLKRSYFATKYAYRDSSLSRFDLLLGFLVRLAPTRTANLDALIMELDSKSRGRVLDVGCGDAATMRALQSLGWEPVGIDFDPVVVGNAVKNGLKVQQGTIEHQNFPDGYFDAITASHVIEHVHSPKQFIAECRRVLKSNGKLVIRTPNAGSWGHHRYGANWLYLDPPRHLYLFSAEALKLILMEAGFSNVSLKTVGRTASTMVEGSEEIAARGRHQFRNSASLAAKLTRETREMRAWWRTKVHPSSGEELVAVATK